MEATIDEATGSTTGLVSNAFGDVLGTSNGSTVTWAPVAVGSYGLLPGSTSVTLDGSHALSAALAWRSHYQNPTGFYYMGARYYDPEAGRFLSPDPMGHGRATG